MVSDRYARQRQFGPIGETGQNCLREASVAVLGCGALGSVAAELLCRSGVGALRVIDRDIVEWSNLQRQSLFDSKDAAESRSKAEAACERLLEINDEVDVRADVVDVNSGNIRSLLKGVDLVIDATDNFPIRFLLNDWALEQRLPWVHGGCVGAAGQVRLFDGSERPCFRCLVPELPPAGAVQTCDTAGVIAPATHIIASLQVNEAIKWLSGNRDAICQDVLAFDFWENRFRQISLSESIATDCVACVQRRFDFLNGDFDSGGDGVLCGRDTVQITPREVQEIDLQSFVDRWKGLGRVKKSRFFVRLHLEEPLSVTLFRDGRLLVSGTDDLARARSLADRFVGN
ncbi:MAG: ThiF family adenylyltransferase [Planctomycetota bacterium]